MLKAGRNIITRLLPKTGQDVEYLEEDDGTYQAGWWRGRLNSNNLDRWIQKTIGGDDIVLDRATGLMWAGDGIAAGCNNGLTMNWSLAIAYPSLVLGNFAGFSDWRVPNINELSSIVYYQDAITSIEQPPFSNTKRAQYWSSTSYIINTDKAFFVHFEQGYSSQNLKTTSYYLRCVRKGL